jgi:pyrimidine deaminase RibD-like protein
MPHPPSSDPSGDITPDDRHLNHLRHALSLARLAPALPTNFRVGAVLVDPASDRVLATGHTMELPGNTHAEQNCLRKLRGDDEEEGDVQLPPGAVLYSTVEPCAKRLSGNRSCVARILATRGRAGGGGVATVVYGLREPGTFVGDSAGRRELEAAGVEVVVVPGLEEEILKVATAGHGVTTAEDGGGG